MQNKPIIAVTGFAGAGKTTAADAIRRHVGGACDVRDVCPMTAAMLYDAGAVVLYVTRKPGDVPYAIPHHATVENDQCLSMLASRAVFTARRMARIVGGITARDLALA